MSDLLSIGLVILCLCLFFSRSISKEALDLLSEQEKSTLAHQFSGVGKTHLIPIILVFAGYLVIAYLQPSFSSAAFVVLIFFFTGFLFFTSMRVISRMKSWGLPNAYIKEYRQSRWIYNLGFTLCGGILLYELLK